jgi:hypothetical protein
MPSAAPSTPPRPSAWLEALYPLLVVALTGLAYGHLVGNYFWLDDFHYLYLMNDRRSLEYVFTVHGGHVQTVRNLVLWLFHALFGLRAELFFAAVLATHLLNALLLFGLLRRVTGSNTLGCFGALLWSANPLNEGSLGWLSVYGHVMVGTLLLWVLLRVQRAAEGAASAVEPLLWYVALLAASLSFGTGVGVACVFPAALALWLPGDAHRTTRRLFWTLPGVTLALFLASHALYYAMTDHLDTTVASAPGVLQVLGFVPPMVVSLLAVALGGLLGGPYPIASHHLQLAALALFGGLAAVAVLRAPAALGRRVAAAVLLSVGAYAMIAIGRVGVLVMSLFSVVEGASWPRYHYVGSIGLAIAVCLLAAWARLLLRPAPVVAAACLSLWVLWMAVGLARNPYRTAYDMNPRQELKRLQYRVAKHVRESPDPHRAYIINQTFRSTGPYVTASDFPGQAAAFVLLYERDRVLGKDVFFVEPNHDTVAAVRRRPWSRTAGLLVTPDEYERLAARHR